MFAIIETSGTQYKIEKGSVIDVDRIDVEEGKEVIFDNVLLVNDKDTMIGTPNVDGAQVKGKVVAHKRGDKIIVFKMKPKKRYQKTQGHRADLTTIEITDIKTSGAKKSAAPKKESPKKEEKEEK